MSNSKRALEDYLHKYQNDHLVERLVNKGFTQEDAKRLIKSYFGTSNTD